jgi:uracil-DNA glycosylase family 4
MQAFDINCQQCPRLSSFLKNVRSEHPNYHARPVPPFGARNPQLLIVGLAPGMHGANATGRPFTGDFAGILLYETLHKFGFCNKPVSTHLKDGLKLINCRLTNAVKCLPPANKPTPAEIKQCNGYLGTEIENLPAHAVILVLGHIAHNSAIKALDLKQKDFPFGHNKVHQLNTRFTLIDSYHCSRYNTNTRRLTEEMFHDVFKTVGKEITKMKT